MKKKCLSCGCSFNLSGSGRRQKYCSKCARQGDGRGRGLPAYKTLKTKGAEKHLWTPIPPGQNGSPIPITTPAGDKGRIWVSDRKDRKGEVVYWRVNLGELRKLGQNCCGFGEPRESTPDIIRVEGNSRIPLTRLRPNSPARDPSCVRPDIWPRPWGYKILVHIETEKELQELGCGWRKVIVELDGGRVHVHHNGRTATMKRDAFKVFLARNKRPRRPQLKLVVSNPPKLDEGVSNAA